MLVALWRPPDLLYKYNAWTASLVLILRLIISKQKAKAVTQVGKKNNSQGLGGVSRYITWAEQKGETDPFLELDHIILIQTYAMQNAQHAYVYACIYANIVKYINKYILNKYTYIYTYCIRIYI